MLYVEGEVRDEIWGESINPDTLMDVGEGQKVQIVLG